MEPDLPLLAQLVDDGYTLLYDGQRLKETDTYLSLGLILNIYWMLCNRTVTRNCALNCANIWRKRSEE